MSGYDSIMWAALCGGLTLVGLVLSWLAGRRRGAAAGLRGVAWSLLPLAAYLTGVSKLLWRFGTAIGAFATSFVFSSLVWIGVVVTGVAVVLFAVSGQLRSRRANRPDGEQAIGAGRSGGQVGTGSRPAGAVRSGKPGKGKQDAVDEEFGDIADILRRRGIR